MSPASVSCHCQSANGQMMCHEIKNKVRLGYAEIVTMFKDFVICTIVSYTPEPHLVNIYIYNIYMI